MDTQRTVRILLADDNTQILNVAESMLDGFEVIGRVQDGQALIETALRLQPDIIVTDISMPVLGGLRATEKLRAASCPSKIIFLTVHADPAIASRCLEAGALGYVVKTRMMIDLISAIHSALAGKVFVSPTIELGK
jgi:DNA-binding NarL/FixJ family response regulator